MKKIVTSLLVIVALIVADQATKAWAVAHLMNKPAIPIIKGVFELEYLENRGAAFGSMQGRQVFLLAVTVGVLAFLVYAFYKMPDSRRYLPLKTIVVLIFSGAIGNMIDRVMQGYVVDFLYFKLINFPIFNVADCYVTVSAFLLIFLVLFVYKEDEFDFLGKGKKDETGA